MKVKNMKLFSFLFLSVIFVVSLGSCKKVDELQSFNKVRDVESFKKYIEDIGGGFDKALILDLRSAELYRAGHISGAINIPATAESVENKNGAFVNDERFKKLEKSKPIFVYGVSSDGRDGMTVTAHDYLAPSRIAEAFGRTKTYCLLGGYDKWEAANAKDPEGYKITTGENP